jgi:hypothetical protein
MRSILISVAVAVCVLLAGGATWFFFQRDSLLPVTAPVTPAATEQLPLPPPPALDASTEERQAYGLAIRQIAEPTNTMLIGPNCTLSPQAIIVDEDALIIFKNTDVVRHSVKVYTIEARLSPGRDYMLDPAELGGPGIYGVRCDFREAQGFIDVADTVAE